MNIKRKVINFIKQKILAIICIILLVFSNITFYGYVIAEEQNITTNPKGDTSLIEPRKVEEMDKLEWEQDINTTIGSITLSENGKEVEMRGNDRYAGKNAIYIIPSNHQEQTLQYSYDIDYGDSFIAAGVLLNVKKEKYQDESGVEKARLKGYMLSFNKTSQDFYKEAGNKLRSNMDIYI